MLVKEKVDQAIGILEEYGIAPLARRINREAAQIAQRKVDAVRRSGATLVASANVGCTVHLARAGLTVTHPVRILDDLFRASDQAS